MEGPPKIVIIENQGDKRDVGDVPLGPGIYVVVPVVDSYALEGTYDYQGAEDTHHWVREPEQDESSNST